MPTTAHSKRHSLNIYPTSGPRPLQLVSGIAAAPSASASTPSHHDDRLISSPTLSSVPFALPQGTPRTPRTPNSANFRRHSSISYKNSSCDLLTNLENEVSHPSTQFQSESRRRSFVFPVHGDSHQNTVTASSAPAGDNSDGGNINILDPGLNIGDAGGHTEDKERLQPLTLAEKHADLLRFIAQKESKCLELRSQLAMHETELVQLKRKWERIASRTFEPLVSLPGSSPSSPSLPSVFPTAVHVPTAPTPAGTVFGGIKESVQRLIASGLSSPSPHSQSRPSTTKPRPKLNLRPHSLYSPYPTTATFSHIRSANLSTSSDVTASTPTSTPSSANALTTTRSSVTSLDFPSSSFFEENSTTTLSAKTRKPSPLTIRDAKDAEISTSSSVDSWSSSELIVRDTGATPMVSPNLKFMFSAGKRQRKTVGKKDIKGVVQVETDNNNGRQRDARDGSGPESAFDDYHDNSLSPNSESNQHPKSRSSLSIKTSPTSMPAKLQRNSLVGMFAPVPSISALYLVPVSAARLITGACGSSSDDTPSPIAPMLMDVETEACASPYQVQQTDQDPQHPSWMSMRWTQKRASKWLSDVSQTLTSAFSLSSTTTTTATTTDSTPHPIPSILDQDDTLITIDEPMKPTTVAVPSDLLHL